MARLVVFFMLGPLVFVYRAQHAPASAHHALLRCPARQYARGSFPETLDLKSTWYDATATEMLAAFVNRTLTAYPRASPPRRLVAPLALPPLPPRRLLRLGSALLYPPLSLLEYMVMFPSGLSSVSLWCSLRLCCPFLLFYLIRMFGGEVFRRHNYWLHAPVCT